MGEKKTIAVVLVAHGEAETSGFLENYRVSRHTLEHAARVMPIAKPLQTLISLSSSLKKKIRPGNSGKGSPQNGITRKQAEVLQNHLDVLSDETDLAFRVIAAFSASPPFMENIIEETRAFDGQILVNMSPMDNSLTCGLLCGYIADTYTGPELTKVKVISGFWRDENLYALYLSHLFEQIAMRPVVEHENRVLLLLFHGTLVADAKGRPPAFRTGHEEVVVFSESIRSAVVKDVRNPYSEVLVAYLNHEVGGEWTKPSFEQVCRQLRQSGARRIDLFAGGYFADGNETIYRAGELAALAETANVVSFPCVNALPAFGRYLAHKIFNTAEQLVTLM
ncbi:ferrochelatase [Chlorobium phaeobacteroides]|jgi:ferrochelatase|uniref:coproporphyrin ferrochelatase n=1 Tax=Chlorobium phaeobacteroides (strain DSM 266 / SMG 266 / 2430) TaxID=290317 RepID=A1BDR1_CHLPD|nr:ferrochelatase [Chlorobium phaeobacteroides]ABL64538.1 ferrochelatase [Chlorobium phaeobacteroides DSM 266]MBV5326563.1 ferrochelatase [Chlorobium sp.]